MSKHTPGPWGLVNDAQGPCMIMHPTKFGVAIASLTNTHSPVNGFVEIEAPGAPERTANAELIAAAPDILDALRALFDEQNDAPLERRRKQWQAAFDRAAELLEKLDP